MSSDGSCVVAGCDDNRVYRFAKSSSGTWYYYWYTAGDMVLSTSISSDGKYILAGTGAGRDNKLYLLSSDTLEVLWTYASNNQVGGKISANGNFIIATSGYTVYLFSRASNVPLWSYTTGATVGTVSISSDGSYMAAGSGDCRVYLFGNTSPALTSGSVSPASDVSTATFTFEVTYKDNDGDSPSYVKVYIDNVGYPMSYVSGTYTSGAVYRYSTKLSRGTHTYYFEASDNVYTVRLPTSGAYSGPTVTNSSPTLSSGSVSPSSATSTTTFTYEVTYSDPEGDAPSYVKVCIDGTEYSMSYVSGSYGAGALFRYRTTLPVGSHTYYFLASDNLGATARLPASGSYSGPTVSSSPPTLSSGRVSPTSGTPGTSFTFEVTYADPDGDAPVYVKVYIDGTAYSMTKVSGTYTSGAIYQYTTTLGIGTHQYYFEASDGTSMTRLPTTGTYSGPTVAQPTLIPTQLTVSPSTFTVQPGGAVTLTATLRDNLGNPVPGKVLSWSASAGSLSSTSTVTDSSGRAIVIYTAPSLETTVVISVSFAGDNTYAASSAQASGSVRAQAGTALPTHLKLSPDTFTIKSGGTISLVALLFDSNFNPLAGKLISWRATDGIVIPASATTDSQGRVSVIYTAPTVSIPTAIIIVATFQGDSQFQASQAECKGLVVIPEVATAVDSMSTSLQDLGFPVDNLGREISKVALAISEGRVAASLTVRSGEVRKDFEHGQVRAWVEVAKCGVVEAKVSSESGEGRTVILNIDNSVLGVVSIQQVKVEVDGQPVPLASDYDDVLDPSNDGDWPEYLILVGGQGIQVLVSIPHFSTRTITVRGPAGAPTARTPLLVAVGIVVISLTLLLVFWKKRE
jgi:hypothetical protein